MMNKMDPKKKALEEIMEIIESQLSEDLEGDEPKAIGIDIKKVTPMDKKSAKKLTPEMAEKILSGEEVEEENEMACPVCDKTECECEEEVM